MTGTMYALIIALLLVITTVVIHYEMLTTRWPVQREPTSVRMGMLRLLIAIFFAHLIEIIIYGFAFYLMHDHLGLGTMTGTTTGSLMDFMYFSGVCYTTLGFGDIIPSGPIRIVVAVESLNGLVLIGWSTSYTYLAMQRFSRAARRLQSRQDAGAAR